MLPFSACFTHIMILIFYQSSNHQFFLF